MTGPLHFTRRGFLELAGLGAAATGVYGASAFAADDPAALAEDAFIWGLPLVMVRDYLKLSQDHGQPLNRFIVAKVLSTPALNVAGPNVDTLYGSAWLDVSGEPQLISVPDTAGRYYCIQIQDAYSNSFAYIGRRATGTKAGIYAITGPGWKGTLPAGVKRIAAPTGLVFGLSRTLVSGEADLAAALAVQAEFKVASLSAYTAAGAAAFAGSIPTETSLNLPILNFGTRDSAYFDALGEDLALNPPTAADAAGTQRFAALGIGPGLKPSQGANAAVLTAAVAPAYARVKQADYNKLINGWSVNYGIKPVIDDPLRRASTAYLGLGAHTYEEALYFFGKVGSDGQPVVGEKAYSLHFPAGTTPPVDAFWSLTVYGADFRLVVNPIDRYSIGDRTPGLLRNADGSLDLQLAATAPKQGTANWLPTPAAGPYKLVLRTYQPRKALFDGSYKLPPLVVVVA